MGEPAMTPAAPDKTKTVSQFLEELVAGTHQGMVDDILQLTKTLRSAKEVLSDEDFKDLRDRWVLSQEMGKGGEKVWSKLLQIGLDDRLEGLKDHLPPTYTTLHLVHCLSDEELKVGVVEGHIHPKVSQGSLKGLPRAPKGLPTDLPMGVPRVSQKGLPRGLPRVFPGVSRGCPKGLSRVSQRFSQRVSHWVS